MAAPALSWPTPAPTPASPPSPSGYLPASLFREDITPRPRRRRRSSSVASSVQSDSSSSGSGSSSSSSASWTSSQHAREDQLQWDESVRQLELIWNVVALPYAAKWAGRKFAYWAFGRYLNLGLGRRFWLGPIESWVDRWR